MPAMSRTPVPPPLVPWPALGVCRVPYQVSLNLSDFVARKICLRSRVSPRHFRANHTKSGEPQLCLLVHMHPNFDLLQTAIN
jgi:hypothetical protein